MGLDWNKTISVYYIKFSHLWNVTRTRVAKWFQKVGQEPGWVWSSWELEVFAQPSSPIWIWIWMELYLNRARYSIRVISGHFKCWGCLVHTLKANCSLRRQPLRWEWQEKKLCLFSIIHSLVHFPLALLVHPVSWGFRSLSQLSPGERWAYTLDKSLIYCRAT